MLLEYNKFNIILYFITGTTVTFGMRRWIYGAMIIILSAGLLIQYNVVTSGSATIVKYKNITQLPAVITSIALLVISVYILSESGEQGIQKLLSIVFIIALLGFNLCKFFFKDNPFFKYRFTEYVSGLLFMVVLFTTAIIPENQSIVERDYNKIKDKYYKPGPEVITEPTISNR